ncbi:hypothetical protein HPB52_021013 [Rhipicephalus sanguineus]|uniref:Uncharacterized protein n=1 Tax=Rhipicephalus sanguineus TaxID=34632 RepID=A0A9D4TBR8_RHISA|nr:hypothetical protein HPB52_021013 [Rhipicephalus sanguineus]
MRPRALVRGAHAAQSSSSSSSKSCSCFGTRELGEADTLDTIAEDGIGPVPTMDRNVPNGTGTKRNHDDRAATFSGELPARKTPSPMFLGANSVVSSDNMSCVSSGLAIEDVLPDSRYVVAKPWNKADRPCLGHRRRQFQKAERDLLFQTGAEDTACHCNVLLQAGTFQGTRHQPVFFSRGPARPYIRRAKKPSARPLEVGMSTSLEVVGVGTVDYADSLGDLARDSRIRLPCMLPRFVAEAGYPKQLHLEATIAVRPAVFSATGSLLVCVGAAPIPPGARGVASRESIRVEELTAPTLLPSWPAACSPTSLAGCLCSLGV